MEFGGNREEKKNIIHKCSTFTTSVTLEFRDWVGSQLCTGSIFQLFKPIELFHVCCVSYVELDHFLSKELRHLHP